MRYASIPGVKRQAAVICLGTAPMGTSQAHDDAFRIMDMYAEMGGNFLDTARVYGQSEEGVSLSERCVGEWIRSRGMRGSVVLGTKGALDYTIYGDPETLRPLMSESNEDYGYFCTFMPASSSMPDVPASAQVQGVVQEMGGLGVEMTLVKAAEASDNYGNVRYQYDYAVSSTYTVSLTSYDGEQIGKVLIRVETLTPDETWTALCRGIAQTAALGLPDGLRQTLADIELNNGGGTAHAEVDGWDIRVGGVMDARSVWDLNRKDAMAHYTYD